MAQEDERKAFARAWGYLSYNPVAKWLALGAAVATGVFYVALLILLWLFADLVVSHGRIPHYSDLLPEEQAHFAREWKEANQGSAGLEDLHLAIPRYENLDKNQIKSLSPREQEFLWRVYLYKLFAGGVGGHAAARVLPISQEMPAAIREKLLAEWKTLGAETPDPRLAALQKATPPLDEARIQELAKPEPATINDQDLAVIWNAYLFVRFEERARQATDLTDAVTDAEIRDDMSARLREKPEDLPESTADALNNSGILPLVIRSSLHDRIASPMIAWKARLNHWMWRYSNNTYLTGLLILGFVLALLRAGASYLNHAMAAQAVIEASTRLRRAVYHHTFRLGTLAFKALGPSEAVSIFTRHIEAIHDALYDWLTVFFREPVKFVLILLFALLVNFWLAVAFLIFAVLVWLIGGQVAAHFRRQGRLASSQAAERLTLIRESLMLMRLVKVYLMELFNQSRVERQLSRYAAVQLFRYRGESIYKPLLMTLGTLSALVLLFVTGVIVLSGQLGVASAITLAASLVSLYGPMENFLEHRRSLRRGREAAVHLFKFLDRPGDVGQVVGAEFLPPLGRRLEFDNVSLREPGSNRMLLQSVTLTIQAGQRVGIIGAEDLEKHALVYLIPRFLDPTSGEIRIDEHNLRWVTLDSLRVQIAMVMQNDLVFHDSVANNIGCGDPSYTLPQIIEAAKTSHAHHFIQKLPEGYETPIGELGHALALGEKFRIALARAILRDPAILIIEEPETPLDENTKALLDDTFGRVLPGRTAIFLPHRISTIRSCDQIVLLHRGRIEAEGDHRELLAQNPLYRHLHYIEFNEIAEQV